MVGAPLQRSWLAATLLVLLSPARPCLAQPAPSLANSATAAMANSPPAQLLLAFKATFDNGDKVLSSWVGAQPCDGGGSSNSSSWLGVFCAPLELAPEGRVITIVLKGAGLEGSIPPEGYLLPDTLTVLNLRENKIRGSIPDGWRLPPKLTAFSLEMNQIGGSVPKLKFPTTLLYFFINNNQLTGSIPADWRLPNLLQLALCVNKLTGSIPWDVFPNSLQELQLHSNQLTGTTLPARLPTGMIALDLAGNKLNAPIPAGWALPPNAETIVLARNELFGTFPSTLVLPKGLLTLDISGNSMTGTLPAFPGLTNATLIVVEPGNSFCGEIPAISVVYTDSQADNHLAVLPSCRVAPKDWGGVSTAAIAGGAVGGVALVALLGTLGWFLIPRRSKSKKGALQDPEEGHHRDGNQKGTGSQRRISPSNLMLDDPLLACINSWLSDSSSNGQCEGQASLQGVQCVQGVQGAKMPAPLDGKLASSPMRDLGVDVNQYLIPFSQLKFERQIGRGSFGRVYLGAYLETPVAIKLLMQDASAMSTVTEAAEALLSLSPAALATLQLEARLMAALRHPNIINFLGLCVSPPCLVLEYCSRGSLHSVLRQAREQPELGGKLTWRIRLSMALEAAAGLLHLHSFQPPVIHRDFRSLNLLVTEDWHVKVSDFSMSKVVGEECWETAAATNPFWLGPEVLRGEKPTSAADVFSLGVVLWELLTWRSPWEGVQNPWQVVATVVAGGRLGIPLSIEELPGPKEAFPGLGLYTELIGKCWAQEPSHRPKVAEVISDLRALVKLTEASSKIKKMEPQSSLEPTIPSTPTRAGNPRPSQPIRLSVRVQGQLEVKSPFANCS